MIKKNYLIFHLIALLLLIISVGCGDFEGTNTMVIGTSPVSTSTAQEVQCTGGVATAIIDVLAFSFFPESVSVFPGQIVKWTNRDVVSHTVTSGLSNLPDARFEMSLAPGVERCLRFSVFGTFPYFCRNHPTATAEIEVR